jgi:hypothetical protein
MMRNRPIVLTSDAICPCEADYVVRSVCKNTGTEREVTNHLVSAHQKVVPALSAKYFANGAVAMIAVSSAHTDVDYMLTTANADDQAHILEIALEASLLLFDLPWIDHGYWFRRKLFNTCGLEQDSRSEKHGSLDHRAPRSQQG